MVRPTVPDLPEDLVKFFRSLKTHRCSAKWEWGKVLEALQSNRLHGSAFWRLCEAGVYHIMYHGFVDKNTEIRCKKLHTLDVPVMEHVGVCFSHLILFEAATKRVDKFRVLLQQIISTLLDAAITAFKLSGFHVSVLQPLVALRDPKSGILSRLVTMDGIDANNKFELAACRIYILSSTIRSIFECGSTTMLPICLPYVCFVICAIFSVNICDPRHSSATLIGCTRHLLQSFRVIVQSCGVNISPAAPSLMTSLVYQLEWSSHFVRSHPSRDSITYKLSVYRCLYSFLDATAQVAFPSLFQLISRIIFEVCSDMSLAARGSSIQSLMAGTEDVNNYELHVCCVVASIRLIEPLFINHSFMLSELLAGPDNGFCDYKIKQALLTLSSEIHSLATRLVGLLNKANNLTPLEQILAKPHFILPFLNTASAIQDYGVLFPKSNALYELSRILLRHNDPLVRTTAQRCHRQTFKSLADLTSAKKNLCGSNSPVSSFTQTEPSPEPLISAREESNDAIPSEAKQERTQPTHELILANATFIPSNCALNARVETAGINSYDKLLQIIDKSSVLLEETTIVETPSPSKGVKRSATSEVTPPIPAKKANLETLTHSANVEKTSLSEGCHQKPTTPDEGSLSVQDVLCTFDDTLI